MGYIIAGLIVAFLALILIRAATFNPKPQPAADDTPVAFDKEAAVSALQQLVQCKTISYNDPALEDDAEFEKLVALLPKLYPNVFETCTFQRLPDRAHDHRGQPRDLLHVDLHQPESYADKAYFCAGRHKRCPGWRQHHPGEQGRQFRQDISAAADTELREL